MTPPADPARCKNHRFPGAILSHGVGLSSRFPLRDRDVQELLCERGIDVTHEALRQWGLKFGPADAPQRKRRRAQPGDKGHVDAVFLTMHGARHSLGRAVDQDANGRAILGQRQRPTPAAKPCLRQGLKGLPDGPRGLITAQRKRYGAAKRASLPGGAQRQRRSLKNRWEHSQRPTRPRAERIQGCKSAGHAQRFWAADAARAHHGRPRRHLLSASAYRAELHNRFARWADITGTPRAAEASGGRKWSRERALCCLGTIASPTT